MTFPLLAKSGHPIEEPKTLLGHTRAVLSAADALFGGSERPTRLARSWLRFFALAADRFPGFEHHLRVTVACHDLGKANDGTQAAMRDEGKQVVYHEHVSGLLIAHPAILDFLRNHGLDATIILSAVLSHHLRCGLRSLGEWRLGSRSNFSILSDHPDFRAMWGIIQNEAGGTLSAEVAFPSVMRQRDYDKAIKLVRRLLVSEQKAIRANPERKALLLAVRAGLIICDAVGSAAPRLSGEIGDWVRAAFADELTAETVWRDVVKRRIADLRSRRPSRWNDSHGVSVRDECGFTAFQRDVADGGDRVLLTAPCGSGKTLAAWNWITAQLQRRPAARVVFLYPTRATATEGFRDYVSWAPDSDAGLFTGTAAFDLEGMFSTPDDPRNARGYGIDSRLYALGHWTKRVVSATVDQFLPFLQYDYGAICRLPMLAESVIVIDEVHSFDRSMFATLKQFLRAFPSIPVLCMTATLGAERRADLVDACGLRPLPHPVPDDLQEVAARPRYQLEWTTRADGVSIAQQAIDSENRVLWVSNRVDDCLNSFDQLKWPELNSRGVPAYCYHSRFKAEDRRRRHNDLVRGFQTASAGSGGRAIFASTSQVCEMSLDIDAQVMVTALAPIAALIQRMGRCNRHYDGQLGRVLILRPEPGKERPYERGELDAAELFVNALAGRTVSQLELERQYKRFDERIVEPGKLCPFLDSGPFAEGHVESFRDIDGYAVSCVLDDDVQPVLEALADRRSIDPFVIPVPLHLAQFPAAAELRLPRWLGVAPASRYTAERGFDGRVQR
jgi:CRISPR-associated endonuclease/helicase Cas3